MKQLLEQPFAYPLAVAVLLVDAILTVLEAFLPFRFSPPADPYGSRV